MVPVVIMEGFGMRVDLNQGIAVQQEQRQQQAAVMQNEQKKAASIGAAAMMGADFGLQKNTMTSGTYGQTGENGLDVKEIKSDLDVMDPENFISQCMTGEDAHDLDEEKTPLEEYTEASLERALVRVKEQRASKQESLESETEKIREIEKDIREKSEEIAVDAKLAEELSRALANSELNTDENTIKKLINAADMAAGINGFGDSAMQFMVANESVVSPKSIQDSLYGSGTAAIGRASGDKAVGLKPADKDVAGGVASDGSAGKVGVPDEAARDGFDEVRPQIEDRLDKDGVAVNSDSLDAARWLYQKELPVTSENVSRIDTVNALKEMDSETLLNRIISEMEDGVLAENADLSNLSKEEVARLVEKLTDTTDKELRETYSGSGRVQTAHDGRVVSSEESLATARRQLEEIRLTMTVSAAREMSKLGISIDIGNLQEMVDKLREFEQQAKEALFEEAELTPTDMNRQIFSGTMDAAQTVLGSPVELLSYTFERRQTITFEALSSEGQRLAVGYSSEISFATGAGRASEAGVTGEASQTAVQRDIFRKMEGVYEAVGTQVRSDLGDSIRKAFANSSSMLEEMGLPVTAENERAVRILGYNRLDITEESIAEMKTYDNRINTLMHDMSPQVVKRMIEEGVNPLELSLPELEREVGRIHEETGAEEVAFSRFLWKLDKAKEISPEERESMIGIYRLLDKIEKSDGAVIGQLVSEGRDLSLKNMLEATRTRRTGHIDAEVSDEAGAVEVTASGRNIDVQIASAFGGGGTGEAGEQGSGVGGEGLPGSQDRTMAELIRSQVPELKKHISPELLDSADKELSDMSFDEFADSAMELPNAYDELTDYYDGRAEELRFELQELDDGTRAFLENLQLPGTIRNLISANDFVKHNMKEQAELWEEEESDEVVESFDDPEELTAAYEKIEKSHKNRLEEVRESDDISYDSFAWTARTAGHISFLGAIRDYRMYEVPLMTEQGVMDMNITIRDGKGSERGTVDISVDSETLGSLRATFKLTGTHVNGFITAVRQDSVDAYADMLKNLENDMEKIGFTMDGSSLIAGNRNSLQTGEAGEVPNRDLYKVAKCFLQCISRASIAQ